MIPRYFAISIPYYITSNETLNTKTNDKNHKTLFCFSEMGKKYSLALTCAGAAFPSDGRSGQWRPTTALRNNQDGDAPRILIVIFINLLMSR